MIRRSVSARPGVAPPTARDRLTGRRSPHVTLTQSPGSYVRAVQSVRAAAPPRRCLPSPASRGVQRPDPTRGQWAGAVRAAIPVEEQRDSRTSRAAGQEGSMFNRRTWSQPFGINNSLLDKFTFYYTWVHALGKQFFTLYLFVTQTNELVSKNLYYIHSQPHCLTFQFKGVCLN